jgi:DevC protein
MSNLKTWISAMRLRTLPLAVSGILMGSALSDLSGVESHKLITILALLTAIFLQILSNLANDFGDFTKGTDNENRVGNMRALQSGNIKPKAMLRMIIVFVVLSLISGISLLYLAADGNIITSDATFLRLFPDRRSDRIEMGLIHLKEGSDVQQVKKELANLLSSDMRVLTTEEWAGVEKSYWETGTSIGFIFGLGVAMGFIVGIVIVYQILYSDVSDHLAEYATLKAMGYSDRFLLSILFQEALLLACLGFLPSFLLSVGLYHVTYAATLLPIKMTLERATFVFVMTVIMCGISGAIAMRKLQTADPADIF